MNIRAEEQNHVLDALERVAVVRVSVPERDDVFVVADRDDRATDLVADVKLLTDDRQDLQERVLQLNTTAF